jgi:hypothetical protein
MALSFVDRDMFVRYLGGGVGHSPLGHSDAMSGTDDWDNPMDDMDDGEVLAAQKLEGKQLEDGSAEVESDEDSDEDSDDEIDEEEWEWDDFDDDDNMGGEEEDDGFDSL